MSEEFENLDLDFEETDKDEIEEETLLDSDLIENPESELITDGDLSHKVEIDFDLRATIKGYDYHIAGSLEFFIALSVLLDEDSIDLEEINPEFEDVEDNIKKLDTGKEEEKASQVVGYLEEIDLDEFVVYNKDGEKVDVKLNENAGLLIVKQDNSLLLSFQNLFTFPNHGKELLTTTPSLEKMQENIFFDINFVEEEIEFEWEEKDNFNLAFSGEALIEEL